MRVVLVPKPTGMPVNWEEGEEPGRSKLGTGEPTRVHRSSLLNHSQRS